MSEITSLILLDLFELSKKGLLSVESKVLFECKNSFIHLNNIVEKVFLHKEDINITLENELLQINEEEKVAAIESKLLIIEEKFETLNSSLEETEERLKQTFFRKAGQLHGHIEHRDPEKTIIELNDVVMNRIENLESRLEELVNNLQLATREIVAQTVGIMLPEIITNEVGKLLDKNYDKIIKKISLPQSSMSSNQNVKKETSHSSHSSNVSVKKAPIQSQQVKRNFSLVDPKIEDVDDSLF